MTPEETRKAAEVMLAWADGKQVQCRVNDRKSEWIDTSEPPWNWLEGEYRIKPEPKVIWVNEYKRDDIQHPFCIGYQSAKEAKDAEPDKHCGLQPTRTAVKYVEAVE